MNGIQIERREKLLKPRQSPHPEQHVEIGWNSDEESEKMSETNEDSSYLHEEHVSH